MKMLKEPEIKLFGRKISFRETGAVGERSGDSSNESSGDCDRCLEQSTARAGEDVGRKEKEEQRDEEVAEAEMCESSEENEESQSQSPPESESEVKSENEEKGRNSEQKGLKKPDKIIPCPRCNSMDTKFCYYNNYNVNQPRHFCKSCQRYWTAGGTMRNVPVGAGRRKNKNCSRHITISDAEAFHNLKFKTNGTVLSFGQDHPQRPPNGYYSKADECTTTRPSIEAQNPGMDGFQHPAAAAAAMQGMNGFPWPFPWNAAVFPPMPYYLWNSGGWNVGPAAESLLGKHPRSGNGDAEAQGEKEKRRGSIVVPKTLRMDDPEEAARSSIWTTLGIKYDAVSREGLFKALQPKGGDKKPAVGMGMAMVAASPMMQVNPAALSRSLAFQERA